MFKNQNKTQNSGDNLIFFSSSVSCCLQLKSVSQIIHWRPFGALVTILRQTGGIPGRPAGMMPCTYNDLSFMNPSSGWLSTVQAGACGTWVSAAYH